MELLKAFVRGFLVTQKVHMNHLSFLDHRPSALQKKKLMVALVKVHVKDFGSPHVGQLMKNLTHMLSEFLVRRRVFPQGSTFVTMDEKSRGLQSVVVPSMSAGLGDLDCSLTVFYAGVYVRLKETDYEGSEPGWVKAVGLLEPLLPMARALTLHCSAAQIYYRRIVRTCQKRKMLLVNGW